MKKKKLLLIALLLVGAASSFAAKVDTLLVKSPSMNKDIKVVVVTPDAALGKKATACPTVYLLHGFGGHAKTWIEIKPNLPQIADEKGIIFVCPDGSTSWYWDSPKDPSFRYETFVSSELVKYIDGHYKTITDRKGRAITGLSMGGHGGLWTAIRQRAGLTEKTFAQAELMNEIEHQCLLEFFAEGHRFDDLKRWYSPSEIQLIFKANGKQGAENFQEKHLYYPIPTSELNNNTAMEQTSLWK